MIDLELVLKRSSITVRYWALFYALKNKRSSHLFDREDLEQAAYVRMLESVQKYNPNLGLLDTFLDSHIQGGVVDEIARLSWAVRDDRRRARNEHKWANNPHIQKREKSLEKTLDPKLFDDPEVLDSVFSDSNNGNGRLDARIDVDRLLSSMADCRKKKILSLYFLNGWYMREIGEKLGLTGSRVSQLVQEGLADLRLIAKDSKNDC